MTKGTVSWFNEAKGFGFIERESGRDIFVHYTSIVTLGFKTLANGDKVRFDLEETERGPVARNVITC